LESPKATFLTRTLSTPIMPKKQWAQVAEDALKTKKPLAKLLQFKVTDPLGCGPFMLKQWRTGVYLYLIENPHFFGSGQTIAGLQLGPNIKGILFKIFGVSDAAILALRKGSIDFYWNSIQPGYLKEIEKDKSIVVYRNKKSGMYFFGFNLRRPPFNDLSLRQAVATLIDKEFIIQRVLQGFGEPMDSVIPSGNVMFYCTDGVNYGRGLDRNGRIIEAQRILKKAGYSWDEPPVDENGEVGEGQGLRMPDGTLMEDFTILTPPADYDPNRAMAGMLIQEWLRQIGMPAFAKPMAFGSLIKMLKYTHDFDCFVLGYGSLSLDPGYVRNFFISSQDRRRGWNMSGFKDRRYDRIANESINTMDIPKRRRLVCEMQKILRRETPYIPLYNPWILEGVRAERFQGWISMVEGIGSVWSFCTVKPVSQAK
jgi:ABC-type transport system substrate-binding protein